MLRKIRKMLKQEEGFTLMELMIAVAIIGILGGIAIPVYNGVQERAKYAVGEANAQMLNRSIVHWIALGMPDENGKPKPQDELIEENKYDHKTHGAGLFAWLGLDEVEYVNW
ncbi:MAG TPA: prepilin-type N-terminal cleavage/methylation domain-containing protein, partial [Limnochordia bacterium]|nr:prepilin-type N-terminal cleavage/methylation domain-containing protein [Limnochordia bacterium]